MRRVLTLLLVLTLIASACTSGDSGTVVVPTDPPVTEMAADADAEADMEADFQLMLLWHQHQPFYPKGDDGVVTRPWVRVHATKDYVDMATTLERYPDVKATFNVTPVLLLQLEELQNGVRDAYWVATETPAGDLAENEQRFLMERFFDVNAKIVDRFPRFRELADRRVEAGGGAAPLAIFSTDDYRDLQVLFNLAWIDPDFLAEEPLAGVVAKGRGFSEDDKSMVLAEMERIVADVFIVLSRMWEAGQIEVTTSPLAHPILPLLVDSTVALTGDPAATMPGARFSQPADAIDQVTRGLDTAERLLGRRPVGMWPGEGAVSQLAASVISGAGVEWIATGEPVLAASLGLGEGFARTESGVPDNARDLYRPWTIPLGRNPDLPIFFRDLRLSDLIGFEYSGTPGEEAAQDFMDRLAAIKTALGPARPGQPWVVSVILDGENAWENYENDGKEFLNSLYAKLSEADWVGTTTPSSYLAANDPPEALPELFPGSWFEASYATWIGEAEEATAWDYLIQARADLTAAEQTGDYSQTQLDAAYEAMLFAEGSDWFWWYGADQSSGDDGYFDRAYRAWLDRMYRALGRPTPGWVDIPIVAQTPQDPSTSTSEVLTPNIDGTNTEGEWAAGTVYGLAGPIDSIAYAFDADNLYFTIPLPVDTVPSVDLYLGTPAGTKQVGTIEAGELGFGATHRFSLLPAVEQTTDVAGAGTGVTLDVDRQAVGEVIEVAIPIDRLAADPVAGGRELEAGDRVMFRLRVGDALYPEFAPGFVQVPDISTVDVRFDVTDPTGDDSGPGTYSYAKDAVFGPGSYDLTRFTAGVDGDDIVFSLEVDAPIRNAWGSGVGLSIQTFDIYVDTDPGQGTGARMFIPGRNAALGEGDGWEYGITVEGWDPAVYVADRDGTVAETKPTFRTIVLGDKGKVIVRVPAELLGGGDPGDWGYAVALLGQEGFPSGGVRRVRDVNPAAEQWRFGGAPSGITNHTRIIDLLWPDVGGVQGSLGEQAAILSGFSPLDVPLDDLTADDVAQVPLLTVSDR